MNQSDTEQKSASGAVVASTSNTRLTGSWLIIARVVWLALVVLTLAIFFASFQVYLAQLQTPCAGTACAFTSQLTPGQVGGLKGIGVSIGDYAAFTVALTLATILVCLVVSTVIVLRRSDDRMALLVALMLVTFGPIIATSSVSASSSPWQVPNECLSFLFVALFLLVLSLFPTGQFVPRWMRWPIVAFLAVQIPFTFFPALAALHISAVSLGFLVFLGGAPFLVVAQLYRYRRVSSPLQQQQTKWVVFGFAVLITYMVLGIVPYLMFPVVASSSSLYLPAHTAVQNILLLLIPLSFGFAMLRSRLWDIDVLINRTLVYGTLTVLLALVYVGLVIGLQSLVHLFTGQVSQSPVVIVASTLAIAALFQPLRHRIQKIIDRRFYRRKYNAAKIIEAFSTTLRNEVDLDQLSAALVVVVQETMQPSHVSLWLRPTPQDGKRTPWRANPLSSSHTDE